MTAIEHMAAFLDMSGEGLYVWGAYLMVAVALGWEGVWLWQRRRRAREADDVVEQASRVHAAPPVRRPFQG